MVPGVDDHQKLVQKVWASFRLWKRMSELHQVENYLQAPTALPCLLQKDFLLPPNSIFFCWDFWEIQHEKMVAYAQALQFWMEKVDLPAKGKPCLLAESVKELQEGMRCYLSFSDEDVFKGVALLEDVPAIQTEEANPQNARSTPASTLEGGLMWGWPGNPL